MRTTLTLDPDVAERIKHEMRRTGRGLKRTVNDALRHGLGGSAPAKRGEKFVVKAFDLKLKPGIDADRLTQLVDDAR